MRDFITVTYGKTALKKARVPTLRLQLGQTGMHQLLFCRNMPWEPFYNWCISHGALAGYLFFLIKSCHWDGSIFKELNGKRKICKHIQKDQKQELRKLMCTVFKGKVVYFLVIVQRPVSSLGVSQHMHNIINLSQFGLYWSSKLQEKKGKIKTPLLLRIMYFQMAKKGFK